MRRTRRTAAITLTLLPVGAPLIPSRKRRQHLTHPSRFARFAVHQVPALRSSALVRHFFRRIEPMLNHGPEKCLGYLTPWEVHFNKPPEISTQKLLHFRSKSAGVISLALALPRCYLPRIHVARDNSPYSRPVNENTGETIPKGSQKPGGQST